MNRLNAVLILDFGGQYCHLIARRIRELGVYSEVAPYDLPLDGFKAFQDKLNVKGLILSGGPLSVYKEGAPKCERVLLDAGLPVLGICYGHQLLAYMMGGEVGPGEVMEYGVTYAYIDDQDEVLAGLNPVEKVWMSHGDTVLRLPEGFKVLAHTDNCRIAAFKHTSKPIYGVQWHPEVVHTEHGVKVLENFVFKVCGCEANWRMEDFVEKAVREVKEVVGEGKAVIAVSGGVDSTTAAALAAKALGRRLTAVFVDHGFMREGEAEQVRSLFSGIDVNFVAVNAAERFMEKLKGVSDPEEKRRIIGELFVRVFEEEAEKAGAEYLVQGTIYPDRIESGFRRGSDKIKTHHNVAGLPSRMKFKDVVEPMRDLYKDEVRRLAEKLGLPREVVQRQPFPGPGLAVRVVGEVTKDRVEVVRRADKIVREEIEKAGLSGRLWQYFAVLTDTKSTGVKGDARAYGYTVAIRAVESRDAMTASFARIPYELLERISTRMTNEIPQVVRVVYDVTHKPPATIEWE